MRKSNLTLQIVIAMVLGIIFGILIRLVPSIIPIVIDNFLNLGGSIFITLMKMLVVPIVFVSLTCGISNLGDIKKLGRLGVKSLLLFLSTTAFAILLGIIIANLFNLGFGTHLPSTSSTEQVVSPSFRQFILNIFPSNPIAAMAEGNVLQIIMFAILFGLSINLSGNYGKSIAEFLQNLNQVIMQLIHILMKFAPTGVFCLIAELFAKLGVNIILEIAGYFFTVLLVLFLHMFVTYGLLLRFVAKLNPLIFFRKMYSTFIFAFSTSSSNASIPLMLDVAENNLGVSNSVASFVIPLGVNINKNGSAIMQGVAAVFIAHAYQINLGIVGSLMVILTVTLSAIGTAGVPSVGIVALVMVLKQVGVPVEGIALIIGVDRLLDMTRTVVNVAGNSAVACIIGKSEKQIDLSIYEKTANF